MTCIFLRSVYSIRYHIYSQGLRPVLTYNDLFEKIQFLNPDKCKFASKNFFVVVILHNIFADVV